MGQGFELLANIGLSIALMFIVLFILIVFDIDIFEVIIDTYKQIIEFFSDIKYEIKKKFKR